VKTAAIVLAVLAVVAAAVGFVSTQFRPAATDPAAGAPVHVEPAARGDLVETASAPGQVQPKTKVQISARISARITDLPFDEGQSVTTSSVLVRLDASDIEAQIRGAEAREAAQEAELAEAKARVRAQEAMIEATQVQLADAQRDLRRQKELLPPGVVTQATVDTAQTKADQLDRQLESDRRRLDADKLQLVVLGHQIDAAKADIARSRNDLQYAVITSPIDGVVTRLNAKVGEMVVTGTMNNAGTVILEVSDLSEMQVDAQVDESNVASVRPGQKAKIRIAAYPDETFDGVVKLVGLDCAQDPRSSMMGGGGSGSAQGKWYRARIVLDTKGKRIPAGLTADADIETDAHRHVLKVPTQAVLGRPVDELPPSVKDRPEVDRNKTLATVVYLLRDGHAAVTPVTIGPTDMTHTLITSGLHDGDLVITGPYKILPTLADNQPVKPDPPTTQPSTTSRPTTNH
jgi:HlyD family secretion protein